MATNWPGNAAVFALCEPRIKQFEGFQGAPYRDSANIPTIGYGTILYPNGHTVTMADPAISEPYASQCLEFQMTQKAAVIAVHLTRMPAKHQAAAMLSLTYNIGTNAFIGSTVLRQFNAGQFQAAAAAFLMWDKATVDGQLVVVPGLLARRQQESALFLTADT
jgi:lysozyme